MLAKANQMQFRNMLKLDTVGIGDGQPNFSKVFSFYATISSSETTINVKNSSIIR
jgi:hypothetical protein